MVETDSAAAARKRIGAWYTPFDLVDVVVDAVVSDAFVRDRGGRPIRVVDPACGDGRFLAAVERRVHDLGGETELVGIDIDPGAVAAATRALPAARIVERDALAHRWDGATFDLVIGNPPFLSQLAAVSTRGGAGSRGGGPYADAAVEFLALGAELAARDGRLAMVLPQSVVASRDAAGVRAAIDERATMFWSRWTGERVFDAQVHTCVVALEFGAPSRGGGNWSRIVTRPGGVPDLPAAMATVGRLGDRAQLNANFRDEYYGMAPAVTDDGDGPPLVTSGLIDPGTTTWGRRPVTFAKRRYAHPRIDLGLLDEPMHRWARRRLVPKVLVANQTTIIEAVCDPEGRWLPGVPVVAVYPTGTHWDDQPALWDGTATHDTTTADAAWEIAAVLTSPVASAWLWHRSAGTGLSANAVRASPMVLAALPWPAGDLAPATRALQAGDVRACGAAIGDAYGVTDRPDLVAWWSELLQRIEARQPVARRA